jgi:23S rRNA (uracil1939-C5)-methyltransferase
MAKPETNRLDETPHEVSVEKWVYGGRGLGRPDGLVTLVPFVLPGELVRVHVERKRHGFVEAALAEVLSPSPERTEPACPYFMRCGGCHYQHASYGLQLVQKREVLRDVLRRVGKLDVPEEIGTISGAPWEYRNRAQFHLAGGAIGYLEAGSSRLCPVECCPISSPSINRALNALRGMTHDRRFPRFLRTIELFTNESEVQVNILGTDRPVARHFFDWGAEHIPGATAGWLEYPAAGHIFRVSHKSFFQVNRFLIDELVSCALDGAEGGAALDLYAGVGLFSLALANRFRSVTAVERGASAVGDLEFNAARASLAVKVERSEAEAYLERLEQPPDFVLADPPRAGLGMTVVRQLLRLRPPRLAIVACDPATLARDLGHLTMGGYQFHRLTLVDLFPQTFHIETIAHLRLR